MDKKILDKILADVKKINPYVTYLNDESLSTVHEWIDTGSMLLNAIISGSLYGGIPSGRITLFAGPSMTGKSFIMQQILRNAQKMGKIPIIIDSETAIDSRGAERFGIDTSQAIYVPTTTALEARNIINNILTNAIEQGQEGKFIVCIDSIGNLDSEMQINRMDKGSTSADMGSFAKDVKSLLKTCVRVGGRARCPIIMTNHIFEDPSAMFTKLIKDQPGGKAVWFLPSVIVQMARSDAKSEDTKEAGTIGGKKVSGVILKFLTAKNRFVKPLLTGEAYLSFSNGLHKYYGLTELAKNLGIILQSGPSYSLPDGTKLGYESKWINDKEIWETHILPQIEERIQKEWKYSEYKEDDNIVSKELENNDEQVLENEEIINE